MLSPEDSSQYTKRCAVYQAILAGLSNTQIIRILKLSRNVVGAVRKKFDSYEGQCSKERENFCCSRKVKNAHRPVRSPEFLQDLRAKITEKPDKSMRKWAEEHGVSDRTIRRACHQDFGFKSYKFRPRQFLNEQHEEKRLERCGRILDKIQHYPLIFFSDEKKFIAERVYNRQNDRYLTDDVRAVPPAMHKLFPASAMMLGVVSNEGHFMPPVFYPKGKPMNAAGYVRILSRKVIPWMIETAGGRPFLFQQDSAPCHGAVSTQDYLRRKLPADCSFLSKEEWPPNSPDLNPLDYHVWGEMVRTTNDRSYDTAEELEAALVNSAKNFNKEALIKACRRFEEKLEQCIANGGKHVP